MNIAMVKIHRKSGTGKGSHTPRRKAGGLALIKFLFLFVFPAQHGFCRQNFVFRANRNIYRIVVCVVITKISAVASIGKGLHTLKFGLEVFFVIFIMAG